MRIRFNAQDIINGTLAVQKEYEDYHYSVEELVDIACRLMKRKPGDNRDTITGVRHLLMMLFDDFDYTTEDVIGVRWNDDIIVEFTFKDRKTQ